MIRILLADDHDILLESLSMLLASVPEVEVVGTAVDGTQALTALEFLDVDLLLTDLNMPLLDGLALTLRVRERFPKTKVLLLTMIEDSEQIREALQAGASGYLFKKSTRAELAEAIHTVMAGQRYLGKAVATELARIPNPELPGGRERLEGVRVLSRREVEIVRLIASGLPLDRIADQLCIAPSTVETHRKNIFKKLDIHSVVGLLRYASKYGLVE